MSQVTSESILTTKTIVEQAIQDYHAQILPYLNGSFPTTIANKFDKANMYSTDEQIVGRWIDGKPLYQRVLHLPDETAANAKVTYDHGISDIENVVKCNGTANYMAGGTTANPMAIPFLELDGANLTNSARAVLSCDKIRIQFTAYNFSFGFHDIYAVIQYTKTTDTAMDIGSDTDYSTTEKIVGTWIDGKPLYQKTITKTLTSAASSLVIPYTDLSANVNASCIVLGRGRLTNADSGNVSLNFPIYFNNNANVTLYSSTDGIHLGIGTQYRVSGANFELTFQYTKTTD